MPVVACRHEALPGSIRRLSFPNDFTPRPCARGGSPSRRNVPSPQLSSLHRNRETPVRLLHFADLHLGIENYGRIDPATGLHTRFADFVRSFRFVVDLALEERVDAALLAGDVYKTPSPNPTWQREFATQLHRLHEASIPIVLVVGNHDAPASFGRATSVDVFSALELGNTYVVRTPQLLTIETASGPLQVVGLPWPTRHFLRADERYRQCDEESLNAAIEQMCSESIREFAARIDTSSAAVLVAHVAATGALYSGSERTAVIGSDPTLSTSSLANPVFRLCRSRTHPSAPGPQSEKLAAGGVCRQRWTVSTSERRTTRRDAAS